MQEIHNLDEIEAAKRAYIAGIFDGEGYVTFSYQCRVPQPRVGITSSNRNLLESIKRILGLGRIYHKDRSNRNWKDTFQYLCTNHGEVYSFLSFVLPYLFIKLDRVRLMMEFVRSRSNHSSVQIIRDRRNGRILGTKPNPLTEREMEIVGLIRSKNKRGRN